MKVTEPKMTTKNNRFTLTFPDGWSDSTVFTFNGPEDSGVKHNIVVTIDPFFDKIMSIAAYAKQRVSERSTYGSPDSPNQILFKV